METTCDTQDGSDANGKLTTDRPKIQRGRRKQAYKKHYRSRACHKYTQSRRLHLSRLLGIQDVNPTYELPSDLVANLVRSTWVKNVGEQREELVQVRVENLRLCLEKLEDRAEERSVLKVVLGQGYGTEKDGEHLIEWKSSGVLVDKSGHSANCVVTSVELSWLGFRGDVKERAIGRKEVEVLRTQIRQRMLDQQTRSKGSIGLHLWFGVRQGAEKEIEERTGVISDGTLQSCDNFG